MVEEVAGLIEAIRFVAELLGEHDSRADGDGNQVCIGVCARVRALDGKAVVPACAALTGARAV
jgi:hypothetical protein